jgi:hypothetical protein
LWHRSKQTVNSQAPIRQRSTALFDHGGMAGSMNFAATFQPRYVIDITFQL